MLAGGNFYRAAAALFLIAVAVPVAGQMNEAADRLEFDLTEAIRLALTSSRDAIDARLKREEQKLTLEAAEERYDLMVSLDVGVDAQSREDTSADVSIGPSLRVPTGGVFRLSWRKPLAGEQEQDASTELSFSQPLLKGFGIDVDTAPLRKARLTEGIHLRAFRDRVSQIVDAVISSYRDVLSARRRVAIADDALKRAQRQLQVNQALIAAGRMARQDLVQTEAKLANREYALIDAKSALETANSTLVNVLDLKDGTHIEPREELPVKPERPDLELSLDTAFAHRTDWLEAETGVELARIELRLARNNLLPDLTLDADVSQGGDRDRTDWTGRLTLTVPFPDNEPERVLVRARNGVHRAEMALAETRQTIRIEVRQAVHDVTVALRQIDIARRAQDLAKRKLDVERRKLQEGLSSAFQLGQFEDDLVAAQNLELDAVLGYRDSLTRLDRTLGTTLERWGVSIEQVGR